MEENYMKRLGTKIITALILSVVLGWLIERLIDRVYGQNNGEELQNKGSRSDMELDAQRHVLDEQVGNVQDRVDKTGNSSKPVVETVPDKLENIKGIGPVIAGKLNAAGIFTFAQLADLTPARFDEIVGGVIKGMANIEALITQAKQLAEENS